ncbi:peptide chain release factor 2 [Candidatus Portiera aleyrodidarum]|uniref:peptide chain release factor 2 n=1 Tax=Candidatus Portiera aleyrodidarum TaxID=91844 RepID=UPI000682173E|nr:peptide chain release factor 2 [Candidatus Portiera aleyrodidarum]ASX27124.1 peptide chain release factor 2 [Candidatus Portiera aleyrodidarum MED (Bemisia tabaci)]
MFDECHENKKAINNVENGIYNNAELLHLAITELDSKPLSFIKQDIFFFEKELAKLDAVRLFSGDFDKNNAYVEIKAGSGGVESQDWANMLVRMYSRWAVTHDFKTETVNLNIGELLGVKSATLHIKGDYAFGWMRTEKGIHRLVRKSPFDSSKRRHTSFTSVFVYPEITSKVHNIKINTKELRIDTYRSSGAGGQHVNTTDSAVRITHLPTKIVVECQSERSQHSNKERALTLLKTKLYDFDKKKGEVERINIEKKKAGICWGNQIRSYVLDAQRIKDLRTGVKNNNCEKVLNGELDLFIEASIKQGL